VTQRADQIPQAEDSLTPRGSFEVSLQPEAANKKGWWTWIRSHENLCAQQQAGWL